jgi:His/Glu/Gln/Arg/opine family amino acid ABC transporter permease subunit
MTDSAQQRHPPGQHPDLSPPSSTVGVVGWLRHNLFSSPLNIVLTAVGAYLIYLLVPPLINWAFVSSVWSGDTRYVCTMGRAAANLGGAVDRIDFNDLEAPKSQTAARESGQYLGQFINALDEKTVTVPASLAAIVSGLDLQAIKTDLGNALDSGNVAAAQADIETLQPIISWGRGHDGACWTFIGVWFKPIIYGRYPDQQLWRVNLAFIILLVVGVPLFIERVKGKMVIAALLLFIYPFIAFYLFSGLDREAVTAWPLRLMGFTALALALLAALPHLRIWQQRSGLLVLIVLVLLSLWGLSAGSTWTSGIVGGAPVWANVVGVVLAVAPVVVMFAASRIPSLHQAVHERYMQLSITAAIVTFIGYGIPILAWDPVAGPTPPWAMAVTGAALCFAAMMPWGYDPSETGSVGRLSALLLPIYLVIVYLVFNGPPDVLNFYALDWTGNTRPSLVSLSRALPYIETPLWGGLFLTFVIGGVGIVASLPIGIVLALGRRSRMPIVRALCVVFIELWRGVPLISVLFMASVMFPLFLPEGMNFDKLLRALIGVALFSSAYMAEVVRGGLQAIPKGQYEAAQALGLSYWKSMSLIIMPQALKLVIPGIVNTFIGLFKDTTLVLIIGLFDLLGMVQLAATNPDWLGFATEGYVFAALGFWVFCFGMSRYSQAIERKLHTGHKR